MKTILIIEDDKDINNLLYDSLKKDFQIFQTYDGKSALATMEEEDIDLVISDLMLPFISGEKLIPLLKGIKDIPIIIITAKSAVDVLVDVLSLGADDYLAKPFDLKELIARINVQLRKQNQTNIISYKDFVMDTDSYQVLYQNQEIDLLQKEFDILKLFLLNPLKVHTKAAIYEQVWEETYYDDENTINVHISRLRKKLFEVTNQDNIKTVWGIGYKLAI